MGIKNLDWYSFLKKFGVNYIFEVFDLKYKLEVVVMGVGIFWGIIFLFGGDLLIIDWGGKFYW